MEPAAKAHEYLTQLSGRKYFIRGNHDKFLNGFEPYSADFEWVKDYHVLKHDKQAFVLFHYPIAEWDGFFHGAIHLYGHVHNSEISAKRLDTLEGRAFNVGVDCNDYRPVGMDEILRRAAEIDAPAYG
jgi:calcineurin-like phosphoesterase family protein